MENIYILSYDTSHLIDVEYDAFHVPFQDSEYSVAYIMGTRKFPTPEKILFQGDFSVLDDVDYLVNDLSSPLLSNKFISLLESLGDFPHRKIPCGIVDYTIETSKSFVDYEKGILNPNTALNEDFSILQLLDSLDIFDYDKSVFTTKKRYPSKVKTVEKIILKMPDGGFPPIFRLTAIARFLFITEAVKEELEAAGIKGVTYKAI